MYKLFHFHFYDIHDIRPYIKYNYIYYYFIELFTLRIYFL